MQHHTEPVKRNNTQPTQNELYVLNNSPNSQEADRIKRKYGMYDNRQSVKPTSTTQHFRVRTINGKEIEESRRHIDTFKDVIYVSGKLLCVKDKRIRLFAKIVLAGLMTVVWNTKPGQHNHNRILTTYSKVAEYFHITKRWAIKVLKILEAYGYIKVTDFECLDICQTKGETQELTKHIVGTKKLGGDNNREKIKEITILQEYKYVSAKEHPIPYVRLRLSKFIRLSNVIGGNEALIYFYLYGHTRKQSKTYTDEDGNGYRIIDYKWIDDIDYIGISYKKRTEYLKTLSDKELLMFKSGEGYRLYRLDDKLVY